MHPKPVEKPGRFALPAEGESEAGATDEEGRPVASKAAKVLAALPKVEHVSKKEPAAPEDVANVASDRANH
jgi:hypothetical protein